MMKYNIDFRPEQKTVVITGSGNVTRAGIQAFHEEYLGDSRWETGMNVMIDFRKLFFQAFRPNDINFIRDLVIGSNEKIGNGKMAIVISSENDFGLARMWEIRTGSFVTFNISVFREMEEATNWINSSSK